MTDEIEIETFFYATNGKPLRLAPASRSSKRRQRKPNLRSAISQASKAGVNVTSADVRPDGTVALQFAGEPAPAMSDLDNWRAKRAR